jgi:hypothetical protein
VRGSKMSGRRWVAISGAVGVLLAQIINAGSATADPASGEPEVPAAHEMIGAGEIAAALERGREREAAGETTDAEESLEDQVIELSADEGAALADEDVTVARLADGLLDVAIPDTVTVTSIEVIVDEEGNVQFASESAPSEESAILTGGPGMGTWGSQVDGQYVITFRNPMIGFSNVIAEGTFLWKREKYMNDGNGTYDWWHYTRKGIAQMKDITGDDYQVKTLTVQSYPYDSVESGLANWTDIDPASDFTGQCSSHQFNTEIHTPIFTAGYTFTDCDGYTVWHNPNVPGSYKITMDQGAWVNEGSRAAGYSVGWKSYQGTPGSMHDFQKMVITRSPEGTTLMPCSTYEQDATCE